MRIFLIAIIPLCIACNNEQGFTNKAEAKNETVNDVKQGKWLEYEDSAFNISADSNSPYYALTIYKAGNPYGMTRWYYKSGKLLSEIPHAYGQINGIMKLYFENGKLQQEVPYTHGRKNGVEKIYYESGQLKTELQYTDDKKNGLTKQYYGNGKLKAEAPYTNDKIDGVGKGYDSIGHLIVEVKYKNGEKGTTKLYDSTGHEIK